MITTSHLESTGTMIYFHCTGTCISKMYIYACNFKIMMKNFKQLHVYKLQENEIAPHSSYILVTVLDI